MRQDLTKETLSRLVNTPTTRQALRFLEWLQYGDWRLDDHEHGNRVILEALESSSPQAIGKLGTSELFALQKYLAHRGRPDAEARTAKQRQIMYVHAGLFPPDHDTFARYARLLLEEVLPELTVVCPWYNLGEARIVKRYCGRAQRVCFSSLHSTWLSSMPWSSFLSGKRVLVALPFVSTVQQQYARRSRLWPSNPHVLPEFHLETLRVPPLPATVEPVHHDWFAALKAMEDELERRNFDVMLVGAGAYSLPLAVHAKRLGKHGIHLGGATQFLFGIRGRRWDADPQFNGCYNEYWCRPRPEETPSNVDVVEGGCYW